MEHSYRDRVAKKWNAQGTPASKKTNFWRFPKICGHFNKRICGYDLPTVSSGINYRLNEIGPFSLGVSVGCGRATKEQALLKSDTVEHFDLYDLSENRLKDAKLRYASKGLRERATFNCEDVFENPCSMKYDLVYWNSSLHHMPDAYAAVKWSWEVLKPGGVFAMFDFTGPTRWQWTDDNLDYVNRFRAALPERLLPKRNNRIQLCRRLTINEMIERDPSEAADSGNILPALRRFFPDSEVVSLGGAIYQFGLKGVWPNLQPDDEWVLDMALVLDDALLDIGINHETFALAYKPRKFSEAA